MHGIMKISQPAGIKRLHRGMCLATAGLAFTLGLFLGILVPVRVFAAHLDPLSETIPGHSTEAKASVRAKIERTLLNVNDKLHALTSNRITEETETFNWSSQRESRPSPPSLRLRLPAVKLRDRMGTTASKATLAAASRRETQEPLQGIFWSVAIESLTPKGYGEEHRNKWRKIVNQSVVVKVEEGCGRMQNRLVTFESGVKACCRYRQNNDQIQGEIFSYYLGRLLNIGNLPPSTLALVHGKEWQWDPVRPYLQLAQWNPDRPVVMTQLLDHMTPAYIPPEFQNSTRRLYPVDVMKKSTSEWTELAQWSDLILFDYLTANLDRVVNNMYNEQWNAEMMHNPAHNLAKSQQTGLLVFFDNESGLLHGYRLLDKYEHFHTSLLNSLCVFRYPTVRALEKLYKQRNVGERLRELFELSAVTDWLPFLPDRYLKILSDRIDRVYQQVISCHKRFGSGSYRWRTDR